MFLSLSRGMVLAGLKRQQTSRRRIVARISRRLTLENLESRLAPATASLSFGGGAYSGNGGGGMVMGVPIDASPLSVGLSATTIVLTYPTGVFNFPVGGSQATADVSLGTIPGDAGGAADWNLTANSTADGNLFINLSAKAGHSITTSVAGGSLVILNIPVSATFAPAAATSETINIINSAGITHTQLVGTSGYALSPAPPYSGTVTVMPPPAGQSPVITTPQSYAIDANTTLQKAAPGLLTGASDPQGLSFAVNAINGSAYTDGTPLTLPSGATLTVNSDGSFSYAPASNFAGTDSFSFIVQDTGGNVSQPGTVNITVTPTLSIVPKTISSGPAGTVVEEDVFLENPYPSASVGSLASFNVALTYDATALTAGPVMPGPNLPADWNFLSNEKTAGIVGIGAFGTGHGQDIVSGPAPLELAAIDCLITGTTAESTAIDIVSSARTNTGTASTQMSGVLGYFPINPMLGPQGSAFIPGVDTEISVQAGTPLTMSPATLPDGEVGVPYQQTVSAAGGTGPYQYAAPFGLPSGLTLNSTTGVFSGTPTATGTYSIPLSASDAATGAGVQSYTMSIVSAVALSTTNLGSGEIGTNYQQTLAASGGFGPYTFSTVSGTVPPGLTLRSAGVLSGTPTAVGNFSFTVGVSDPLGGSASRQYSVTITSVGAPITLSPTSLPDGSLSASYSQTITAIGGTGPCSFAVTAGTLPTGLTLSSAGVLQGTPKAVGVYAFTVTATDTVSASASQSYTVTIGNSGLLSLPSSGYSGSQTSPVMNFPVNVSALSDGTHTGLASANIVLTYPAGIFDFPIGGEQATRFINLGSIPLANGAATHWGIAANSPIDGVLDILLSADPGDAITSTAGGSLVTINFPIVANPAVPTPETITLAKAAGPIHSSLAGSNGGYGPALYGLPTSGVITIDPSAGGSLSLGPNTQPEGDVGVAYSQTIAAFGGTAPYTFAATSATLPPGLTLSTGGVLAGTPTTAGVFTFMVTATDSTSQTASQNYTVTINPAVVVPTTTVPNGAAGTAYHATFHVAGGSGPYTFSTSDTLPTGLTLDSSSGVLSGTPAAAGSYRFMITATDSLGTSVSQNYTLTVPAGGPVATVYVDPSFTGSGDPATDPGLGLMLGVNAFSTITGALQQVMSGGTLVLYGGTYDEPSVNFNVALAAIDIASNPNDSPVSSAVTITNPVTLSTDETFTLNTGASVASTIFSSTVDGPAGLTISGGASLTFDGNVGGGTPLSGVTVTGASSFTLGSSVMATVGTLSSASSTSSIVLGAGSELITGAGGSSTFAGSISGAGELSKVGPTTGLTLSGNNSYTGPTTVVGTLIINGSLGASASPLSLIGASSVLNGSGNVQRPVIVTGTATGAQIEGVSIAYSLVTQQGTNADIDVQAGADKISINHVTVSSSNIGVVVEPGNGNHLSITSSTIRGNTQGLEVLNGVITITGNSLLTNSVGVEIPATNPDNSSLPVDPLLTLEGNLITGNTAALMNGASMGVTAILDWWGIATGPGTGQVMGVPVDAYTPYALDATSAGANPTTFDFFNGTGADGNVYVTGALGTDAITAIVDTTNANLIHVSGPTGGTHYLRGGASNRVIIYGFGDNAAGAQDSITVMGGWNAEIHAAALAYAEPLTFSGLSRTTISTTGTGSDVIFGGGNDLISALTSGNNVIVAGQSTGKTGAPAAPRLSGGSGANIFIAGSVDGTLAPLASSGRLDYETLRAMDDLWAAGSGDANDAMNAAALFNVANTVGAISTGTARAFILPGNGPTWLIVKGSANPTNTPTGVNNDYAGVSSANRYYRQAIT